MILSRLRRPAIGWLQLFVVLFWTFTPAMRTGAIYVPDQSRTSAAYWLPLNAADPEPTGPETGDSDGDGTPNWLETFDGAYELLRCRVRHFTDGAALGGKEFVNRVFEQSRERFGSKRKTGARPLRADEAGKLHALRDLRTKPRD